MVEERSAVDQEWLAIYPIFRIGVYDTELIIGRTNDWLDVVLWPSGNSLKPRGEKHNDGCKDVLQPSNPNLHPFLVRNCGSFGIVIWGRQQRDCDQKIRPVPAGSQLGELS